MFVISPDLVVTTSNDFIYCYLGSILPANSYYTRAKRERERVCVCVRACVRASERACVRACVRVHRVGVNHIIYANKKAAILV